MTDESMNPIELAIPGQPGFEWMAIQSAAVVAERMRFSPARIEDVKTVVGEAFLNAIKHGNRGRSNKKVILRFYLEAEALRIDIVDQGRGFDPDRLPEPQLHRKMRQLQPPGGWGMFLIRRLVNRLEVRRKFPRGHCLSLTIRPEPVSDPVGRASGKN